MREDTRSILEMLAAGQINPEEAERLLAAVGHPQAAANDGTATTAKPRAKYLRVQVDEVDEHESGPTRVNIRVPMQLLRAGVKLASLVPAQAHVHINTALHQNGVPLDLSQIKPENLEEIVNQLEDLSVDVDEGNGKTKVRVFCE